MLVKPPLFDYETEMLLDDLLFLVDFYKARVAALAKYNDLEPKEKAQMLECAARANTYFSMRTRLEALLEEERKKAKQEAELPERQAQEALLLLLRTQSDSKAV